MAKISSQAFFVEIIVGTPQNSTISYFLIKMYELGASNCIISYKMGASSDEEGELTR